MAKSFKDKIEQKAAVNPTMQFISQPETATTAPQTMEESRPKKRASTATKATTQPRKTPSAHRAQPQYGEEIKSRRLQLLLTPSLYEDVKEKAAEEQMSVNELINTILENATRK